MERSQVMKPARGSFRAAFKANAVRLCSASDRWIGEVAKASKP